MLVDLACIEAMALRPRQQPTFPESLPMDVLTMRSQVGGLTEDWARKKKDCSRPNSRPNSRPCSPQPPHCDPPATYHPPAPACPPEYGHHGGHGMYSPPMVHAQTTTNTHVDVQPGMMHHQPHYPTCQFLFAVPMLPLHP